MAGFDIQPGRAHPLGATPDEQGVNFSLYSQHAESVELLLFEKAEDREPAQTIRLTPGEHRSFFFWHVYVAGLSTGWHYAYRVDGPQDGEAGHRFNPNKVLIDPYA
ncbi:MAG: glycogen debranching enzyme, partial [Candidatus Thiodiazotropha sp.]